jgi:ethanolamine ammonia-lyase small subunit
MTSGELSPGDAWTHLRRHTAARIALGRTGGSLPTAEWLRFEAARTLARAAVHAPFEAEALAEELRALPADAGVLASAAPDRTAYLRRPDLGRRLADESRARLAASRPGPGGDCELVVLVSDGLSALAARRQAPPLLHALWPRLRDRGFRPPPVWVIRHARVAIIDEVGAILAAELVLVVLGERPGLDAPDSLGAYFGYRPGPGRTDADRNCVSNIRPAGLPPEEAAEKLAALLDAARRSRLSGTGLKDPSNLAAGLPPAGSGPVPPSRER